MQQTRRDEKEVATQDVLLLFSLENELVANRHTGRSKETRAVERVVLISFRSS